MYCQHFGLRDEPFSLSPDPQFLYLSEPHAEALAGIRLGIEARRGLIVITGEVGTGKTTLLYSLLSDLGPQVKTAYLSNTKLSFVGLLRQALADLGVPTKSRGRVELLSRLNMLLGDCARDGTTVALVVDEAQNLDEGTFEDLRLLSNFETHGSKLLQIVLVGQPELAAKLRQPGLRQVAERVAVYCHLPPLTRQECRRYIAHRLECVGGTAHLFTRPAVRLILRESRGIPRRINILCHNALLFAYGLSAKRVTRARVRAAATERRNLGLTRAVGWEGWSASRARLRSRWAWVTAAAVAVSAGVAMMAVTTGTSTDASQPDPVHAPPAPPMPLPALISAGWAAEPSPMETSTACLGAEPAGMQANPSPRLEDARTTQGGTVARARPRVRHRPVPPESSRATRSQQSTNSMSLSTRATP